MEVLARNVHFLHFIEIGFYSQTSITRNINKCDSERNSVVVVVLIVVVVLQAINILTRNVYFLRLFMLLLINPNELVRIVLL